MESESDKLLDSLNSKIASLEVRKKHKPSKSSDFLLVACILLSIVFAFIGDDFLKSFGLDNFSYAPVIGIGSAFYFGFAYSYILTQKNIELRSITEELESLKFKRDTIRPLRVDREVTYFDRLVDINISNLSDYYSMVKQHTEKSFLASMSAGSVGFLLIVTGLLIGSLNIENATDIAYISAGSGVVIEFISGVFFWLYSKTTQQLKGYHDSLVSIQNVLLSFKVIEDTSDEQLKLDMAKTMISTLNSPTKL